MSDLPDSNKKMAFKEHNWVKTYRINKAAAAKENFQDIQSTNISPYQNKRTCGRALKKLLR